MNSKKTQTKNENKKIIHNQYKIGQGGTIEWFFKLGRLMSIQSKKLVKTPMMIFAIFGLPLILLFGIGSLVQDTALLTPCFGMIAIAVSGIIFGDLYYTIEKTTLENQTSTTNYGHKTKLLSISATTFIFTFIAIISMFIVFFIFEIFDLFFMPAFVFFGNYSNQALSIIWGNIQWLCFIYYIVLNILLTLALFIFMKTFFKTNKTFIMFVLTYVLLDIMFGGVLIMNYNQAVVKLNDKGQLQATGEISNSDFLLNESQGQNYNIWEWDSWYSFTKFFIPHYFLNQQFATLFKAGSEQQMGAFWFDSNGIYHINWDVALSNGQSGDIVDEGYKWMVDAQNMIIGNNPNYNPLDPNYLYSYDDFHSMWIEQYQAGDTSGVFEAFYTYNRALPIDAKFFSAYNGDYTFILCETLPWVYTIFLTWIGFIFSRIKK